MLAGTFTWQNQEVTMEQTAPAINTIKCDACQKDIPKTDIRYMSLKMCCKIERVPLCKNCWEKYAKKNI